MADVTVTQFAEALKIPVDRLMTQLDEAGIQVGAVTDIISDDKKMVLLSHLRRNHGHDVTTESASPKQITLKRKQSSELRLAAGQGRTRTVNVEVRRKRTYVNREVLEAQAREERDRRAASVEDVRAEHHQAEEEARRQVEEETRKREAEESRRREEEDARKLAAEEEAKRREAEETRLKEENQRKAAEDARRADEAKRAREREARQARDRRGAAAARPGATKYGRAELHVAQDKSGRRRKKRPARRRQISVSSDGQHGFERPTAPVVREVTIPETISVSELSQRMAVKATEVIRQFMGLGAMVTINQVIDQETAALVVEEMGHTPKLLKENELEEQVLEAGQAQGETVPRPPVVTIMGHVDHGKTSLLDFIRSTKVTAGEAGGITQHIGAYHIASDKGGITFLDTPGHAAFTAMRARGAEVTDIVILVVAADDGVMPQTIEAIQHAKAAEVPVIVAINKIDRPEADPERVKNELTQHSIIPEDWGGDNMFVEVSAKTGQGVDSLLETILLQAELLELRAVDTGPASGVVLESSLEKGRGAVATLLIASGRMKVGDSILAGQEHGRVRAMFDDGGEPATEEGPSMPVQVLGLSGTPNAGDDVVVLADERKAREVALHRQGKLREVKLAKQQGAKLEDFMKDMVDQQKTMLNIVIKADVQGSAEALKDALSSLSRDEVQVNVVMSGVGGINESDVNLALSSEAIVIGFNVRADASARTAVAEKGIDLHYHSVIYEAIDQIKRAVGGMLAPEIKEQIRGLAEVREVFKSPKFGNVAGCMVLDGFVRRNLPIRVLRDNVVIYEGELESLRRFKDDVNEVRAGTECGIGVLNYKDVRDGDQIECFERYEVAREI